MRSRCLPGVLLLVSSCVPTVVTPPAEPPPPRPVVVPDGCLSLQAGPWVHAADPAFRYAAVDDGGTLTLLVTHTPSPDAGFSPRRFRVDAGSLLPVPDAGPPPDAGVESPPAADGGASPTARVVLERTPQGFVGFTLSPAPHPSGRQCEARFPTRLLACSDGGLLLEADSAAALGDACQAPARPQGLTTLRHLLIRPDAG